MGTNQEPAQFVVRRISDCAVVRSSTDGHDAHVTYCDFAYSNSSKDNCDFAYSNITDCDIAYGNVAGFSGCFCLPRRLV